MPTLKYEAYHYILLPLRFHNPEFTQMELYVAYKDYSWMMDLVEKMVEKIAMDLHGTTEVKVGENIINFQRPWRIQITYCPHGKLKGRILNSFFFVFS